MAFTLAEMMVVLLIMSIVLACLAPAMTTKMKADQSIQTSPWKWARNNTDAYFSVNSAQSAMIGQSEKGVGEDAKLIISDSSAEGSAMDILLYKYRNNAVARLRWFQGGLLYGLSNQFAPDSVAIGINTRSNQASVALGNNTNASGQFSTAVGPSAQASTSGTAIGYESVASDNSVAIGSSVYAHDRSVVIGTNINGNSENIVVIGNNALVSDVGGTAVGDGANSIHLASAFGSDATASGGSSVAIGRSATASESNSVAIGNNAQARGKFQSMYGYHEYGSTSIGANSISTGAGSIAVSGGLTDNSSSANNTTANGDSSIAIGSLANTLAGYNFALAMGYNASTIHGNSIAIGRDSTGGESALAFGYNAKARAKYDLAVGTESLYNNQTGTNNTAIGYQACYNVTGSNKTCIGANSGPAYNSNEAKSNDEVIYIGSKPKSPWPLYFNDWGRKDAVLEIWNTVPNSKYSEQHDGRRRGYQIDNGPTVYVNGNLVVRGYIAGLIADDRGDEYDEWGVLSSNKPTGDDGAVKWGYVSDRRLKYVGKENNDGLEKIKQLKVFNYTFKKDENKTPRVGVMAQDLQKIFPNAVKKGTDGFLTIRMEDMFYAVINAIKELDAKYQAQQKRIEELEKRVEALEAKIK